jgi:galactose mutarotase-like enzyme
MRTPFRNNGARIHDKFAYDDLRVVILENEFLRIMVLADQGGDVVEFLYKPRDVDFMWHSPLGIRNQAKHIRPAPDERAFTDYYEGGWQEMFPHASAPTTYKGARFGWHGEVWAMPWNVQVEKDTPKEVSVLFWVRTVRSPFLLERRMTLRSGEPTLHILERVTNEGTVPLEFMWGHHIAYGAPILEEGARIFAPARTVRVDEVDYPWPAPGLASQAKGGGKIRHDIVSAVKRDGELMKYLLDLEEGWYALVNPRLKVGIGLRWDKEVFSCVWMWNELRYTTGVPWYGRTYAMALEPVSSLPLARERATRLLMLCGGASLEVEMKASAFEGITSVSKVTRAGKIIGR